MLMTNTGLADSAENEPPATRLSPSAETLANVYYGMDLGAVLQRLGLLPPPPVAPNAPPAMEPEPPPVPEPKPPEVENLGMFEVTCYSLRGTTKSGRPVGPGVVAVDPRVIPLGESVYVPGYGQATALDTGGAIKGKTLDVWMPSRAACMNWGRKVLQITRHKP